MQQETIDGILESIEQLRQDHEIPESIQLRLEEIEEVLHEEIDIDLRAERVKDIIQDLDEHDDLPDQARTQLWSIDAMLELF